MIYLAGDTHGTFDLGKLIRFFECAEELHLTKNDYVIILGDCGVVWDGSVGDEKVKHALQKLPVTVLFIDGNHENFDLLNSYPVEEWHGGKVHIVASDIIHLMRGQLYNIEDKTFFTFGGAFSVDKALRREGIDWWPEEIPTNDEYKEGWRNLEDVDLCVDFILTHTAPMEVVREMGYDEDPEEEQELRRFLQKIVDNVSFDAWFFGHFHEDVNVDDTFIGLYDNVICLDEMDWDRLGY